jgi:hypothetical protein
VDRRRLEAIISDRRALQKGVHYELEFEEVTLDDNMIAGSA